MFFIYLNWMLFSRCKTVFSFPMHNSFSQDEEGEKEGEGDRYL